jgi:hypothetical protein
MFDNQSHLCASAPLPDIQDNYDIVVLFDPLGRYARIHHHALT